MKQLNINCPEGHEIDLGKSNLAEGVIYFKEVKKVLTYNDDVVKDLFVNKYGWFIKNNGNIDRSIYDAKHSKEPNTSTSKEQLESILALNKLCNVAKYLNGDWLPSYSCGITHFYIDTDEHGSITAYSILGGKRSWSKVYFKTKELAQQAIEILGEDVVRKALTLNH